MNKNEKDPTNESRITPLEICLMKEQEGRKMQPDEGESDIMRLVKELQGCLKRNDFLEKENQELRQEVERLKPLISSLKAHDNERKSMLWKKLQNSFDGCNINGSNQKPSNYAEFNEKGLEAKNLSPRSTFQESAASKEKSPKATKPTTATIASSFMETKGNEIKKTSTPMPPPPPPLPSKSLLEQKSVRRVPEVVELYRALTRRESQNENRMNHKGILSPMFSKNMIGEIENRSRYLSAIKFDVERQKDHINFLINKVESAVYRDISDVEAFVSWLDQELSSLVDERAVLKHFPRWPERKADVLREAAINYRGLRTIESEVLSFKDNPKEPLTHALQRIQSMQDRLEESVSSIERMRESTSKRYRDFQIPWDWMLDTGLVGQMKHGSLRLGQEYMRRITKEVQSNECLRGGNMVLQAVRFAYKVHQFAGGFDGDTISVFNELKKICTGNPKR